MAQCDLFPLAKSVGSPEYLVVKITALTLETYLGKKWPAVSWGRVGLWHNWWNYKSKQVNRLLIGEVIIWKWIYQNTWCTLEVKISGIPVEQSTVCSTEYIPLCVLSFDGLPFLTATVFAYAKVHRKMPPQNLFYIYSCNKEIYYTFKTCCIISVLFFTKYHWFQNFIPFCSDTMFFKNYVLKLKYPPWYN